MHRAFSTLRLFVALVACFVGGIGVASASTFTPNPNAEQYAVLLRSINPHLHVNQSVNFARTLVADAARTNLDPRLIVALVTVESHWRPNALSPVGARGLGQLMPGTAATLRVNAWDPVQNIRGAATYLRAMLDHFAGRGQNTMRYAIGAYNAGPKAVDRYHGIPPFVETQNYVRKVLAVWRTINGRVGRAFAEPGDDADLTATADGKLWMEHPNASALAETALPLAAAVAPVSVPDAGPSAAGAPDPAGLPAATGSP